MASGSCGGDQEKCEIVSTSKKVAVARISTTDAAAPVHDHQGGHCSPHDDLRKCSSQEEYPKEKNEKEDKVSSIVATTQSSRFKVSQRDRWTSGRISKNQHSPRLLMLKVKTTLYEDHGQSRDHWRCQSQQMTPKNGDGTKVSKVAQRRRKPSERREEEAEAILTAPSAPTSSSAWNYRYPSLGFLGFPEETPLQCFESSRGMIVKKI